MSVQPTLAQTTLLGRTLALPVYVRQDLAYMSTGIVDPLAAGLSTVFTVPGGQIVVPQQITVSWTTSATVANRYVGLQFKDSAGNVIGQTYMNGAQPASTSYNYTFMLDAGSAFVAGNFGIAPLPFMLMYERWQWHIVIVNADSGDNENGLTYTNLVLPTGPPLASSQPALVPAPVLT